MRDAWLPPDAAPRRAGGCGLLAVQYPVDPAPLEVVVRWAAVARVAWAPAGGEEVVLGFGVAAQADASGGDRWHQLLEAVSAVRDRGWREVGDGPGPRWWGGARFSSLEGGSGDGLWRGFGDARFALCRWEYRWSPQRASWWWIGEADAAVWRYARDRAELAAALADSGNGSGSRASVREQRTTDWEALVRRGMEAISCGALRKVVVARRRAWRLDGPAFSAAVAARLLGDNESATRFILRADGARLIGATPEHLVSLTDGGTTVQADALAGTRAVEADEVLWDNPVLRAEFGLVRDYVVAALRAVGVDATADAPREKRAGTVRHLYSRVTGRTRTAVHPLQAVAALHPTPAVCGVPTDRARAWLRANEDFDRGWFAGPVGWFDAAGNGDFAVAIRSALLVDDTAYCFAGNGLVAGARVATERAEVDAKEAVMRTVVLGQ